MRRVCIRDGERQSSCTLVGAVEDEILTTERVVEATLLLVQLGGRRIPGSQSIRRAVDEQHEGRAEARNEVRLTIAGMPKKVVVVVLVNRERRQRRNRPWLGWGWEMAAR